MSSVNRLRLVLSDCIDRNSCEELEDLDTEILEQELQSCPFLRELECSETEMQFLAECKECSTEQFQLMLSLIGINTTEDEISSSSTTDLSFSQYKELLQTHTNVFSELEEILSISFDDTTEERKIVLFSAAFLFLAAVHSFD